MNYIKKYESFSDKDIQVIKDILLELEDEEFNIEYQYDSNFKITQSKSFMCIQMKEI